MLGVCNKTSSYEAMDQAEQRVLQAAGRVEVATVTYGVSDRVHAVWCVRSHQPGHGGEQVDQYSI